MWVTTEASIVAVVEQTARGARVQPLGDRIVVRPAKATGTTASGLVIPETAHQPASHGEVVALGPPVTLPIGCTVVYAPYSGTEVTLDDTDLLILKEGDVLALLDSGAGAA